MAQEQESFGEQIHKLRRRRKLALTEVAGAAGISPSALSRYERDLRDPPHSVAQRLLRFLNYPGDGITPDKRGLLQTVAA